MRAFAKSVFTFLKAEDGPTAVEYAVMLSMIIVICLGAITALGNNTQTMSKTAWSALPVGS